MFHTWKIPSPLATGIDFPKAKNKACNFFVKQMSCAAIAHLISRLFVRCFTFRIPEKDVNTFRNDVKHVQGVSTKSFQKVHPVPNHKLINYPIVKVRPYKNGDLLW